MLTKAEQILLEGVRAGEPDLWREFLDRYQGRLYSYAHRVLNGNSADAEDVVQDVFISFLKNIKAYEGRSSLESWLFMILRRRLIDIFRRRKSDHVSLVNDLVADDSDLAEAFFQSDSLVDNMTASGYARNSESQKILSQLLTDAFTELVDRLKDNRNLRDLKIIELAFYAGLGNKQIASLLELDTNVVAVTRHRCMERLRDSLAGNAGLLTEVNLDGILRNTWITGRFTCPKRSTIGSWMLGSLDKDWAEYVDFHINKVGCAICRANLDDLDSAIKQKQQEKQLNEKLFESSIGFLN